MSNRECKGARKKLTEKEGPARRKPNWKETGVELSGDDESSGKPR